MDNQLKFHVEEKKCTGCGQCVDDCPTRVISLEPGKLPAIAPHRSRLCIRCQHCLAVCPTGALSILGRRPENSLPLGGMLPSPSQVESLIKGRRSVRRFRQADLDRATLERLVEAAAYAPSGENSRAVHLTLVSDRTVMERLRRWTMQELKQRVLERGSLPPSREVFAALVRRWKKDQRDVLFRDAPHLVIASARNDCPTPEVDCLLALANFDLMAQALGVGTLWNGLATWAFTDVLPHMGHYLELPPEHRIGYVLCFGWPAVKYHRSVQHQSLPATYLTL